MRIINKVIWHCSASSRPEDDSIDAIRNLHTSPESKEIKWGEYDTYGRGWSDIGYHFFFKSNGEMEFGRPIFRPGAHVRGLNTYTIGICLSGVDDFPDIQINSALRFTDFLMQCFNLENLQVFGHYELDEKKTCPNMKMYEIRQKLLEIKYSRTRKQGEY